MKSELIRLQEELQSKEFFLKPILKAISNPIRLSIMFSMISGKKKFQLIVDELDEKKTIVSNHLKYLKNAGIIDSLSHGSYQLSEIGILLLESLEDFIKRSARRPQTGPAEYLNIKPLISKVVLQKNSVKNIPTIQPSRYTLIASVTGILQSFGEKIDVVDVSCYSGQAFLASMTKGVISSTPTTAHPFFKEIHEGIESLGFELIGLYDPGPIFPERKHSWQDEERLLSLYQKVRSQIDMNNPVILWGPGTAEFAIVYGYDNDSYLVSSYKTLNGKEEKLIDYRSLHLPGGIWYYFFGKRTHKMTKRHDHEALKRALKITMGANKEDKVIGVLDHEELKWNEEVKQYVTGPTAFEIWKEALLRGNFSMFENHLISRAYEQAYDHVSIFFKRLEDKYSNNQIADSFSILSDMYSELSANITKYLELTNFDKPQIENKKLASICLSRCKEITIEIINKMKYTVEYWES
ncbi:MAG: winged helix-turn-helix transcriptional regulator [Candidatus Heimdallarchaeota archaeon]|nr:winged helix-turn-helix transcriptional regulator [Candidatus Heimdallarchaeota archaeon]